MPVQLKKLRKALKAYGVWEEPSRGKGSHTAFLRTVDGKTQLFPIPTHRKEVVDSYVKNVRRKLSLMPENGVTDEEFESHY